MQDLLLPVLQRRGCISVLIWLRLSPMWVLQNMHKRNNKLTTRIQCSIAPEDFGDWEKDIRGGVLIMASRQVARALQGKTWTSSADTVMSDDDHDAHAYLDFLRSSSSDPSR